MIERIAPNALARRVKLADLAAQKAIPAELHLDRAYLTSPWAHEHSPAARASRSTYVSGRTYAGGLMPDDVPYSRCRALRLHDLAPAAPPRGPGRADRRSGLGRLRALAARPGAF
jgi:hypothetical protein